MSVRDPGQPTVNKLRKHNHAPTCLIIVPVLCHGMGVSLPRRRSLHQAMWKDQPMRQWIMGSW